MTVHVTPATQTATIEDWLPAQVSNGSHGHWSKRRAIHMEGVEQAFWSAKKAQLRPMRGLARLTITLVFPNQRRRDADNLTARCKGIIDGLVRAGVLEDDDTAHLELTVRAEVAQRREVRLTLEGEIA